MPTYDLHFPETLNHALELLEQHGEDAHLIAGGTAVVLLLNQGLLQPGHLISLRKIDGLSGVERTSDGGLRLGAMATHRQAETNPSLLAFSPALAETFSHVATVRIRNQGTVGGNLAHADPAQDPPPMLMALDAEVEAKGRTGVRKMPLQAFFVDYFQTALQPGEVLTAIAIPPQPAGARATYIKFLPRTADDYATVSVAARLRVDADGSCRDLRVALGSAGTVPLRARLVEQALEGDRLTPERVREAAALVRDEVDPLDDVRGSAGYKREMARVWTERAILRLAGSDTPG